MLLSSGKQSENCRASQSFNCQLTEILKYRLVHPPELITLLSFGEFWHREIYFLTHSRLYVIFGNVGITR